MLYNFQASTVTFIYVADVTSAQYLYHYLLNFIYNVVDVGSMLGSLVKRLLYLVCYVASESTRRKSGTAII